MSSKGNAPAFERVGDLQDRIDAVRKLAEGDERALLTSARKKKWTDQLTEPERDALLAVEGRSNVTRKGNVVYPTFNMTAPDVHVEAPVVNVQQPARRVRKTIHRDATGLITHITEEVEE